jgi:hypothetical protein
MWQEDRVRSDDDEERSPPYVSKGKATRRDQCASADILSSGMGMIIDSLANLDSGGEALNDDFLRQFDDELGHLGHEAEKEAANETPELRELRKLVAVRSADLENSEQEVHILKQLLEEARYKAEEQVSVARSKMRLMHQQLTQELLAKDTRIAELVKEKQLAKANAASDREPALVATFCSALAAVAKFQELVPFILSELSADGISSFCTEQRRFIDSSEHKSLHEFHGVVQDDFPPKIVPITTAPPPERDPPSDPRLLPDQRVSHLPHRSPDPHASPITYRSPDPMVNASSIGEVPEGAGRLLEQLGVSLDSFTDSPLSPPEYMKQAAIEELAREMEPRTLASDPRTPPRVPMQQMGGSKNSASRNGPKRSGAKRNGAGKSSGNIKNIKNTGRLVVASPDSTGNAIRAASPMRAALRAMRADQAREVPTKTREVASSPVRKERQETSKFASRRSMSSSSSSGSSSHAASHSSPKRDLRKKQASDRAQQYADQIRMQHKKQAADRAQRTTKLSGNSTPQRGGFRISQPRQGHSDAAATPDAAKKYAEKIRKKHKDQARLREVGPDTDQYYNYYSEQEREEHDDEGPRYDAGAEYAESLRDRNRKMFQRLREPHLPGSPNETRDRMRSQAGRAKGAFLHLDR